VLFCFEEVQEEQVLQLMILFELMPRLNLAEVQVEEEQVPRWRILVELVEIRM
jgi:hypothetical protein